MMVGQVGNCPQWKINGAIFGAELKHHLLTPLLPGFIGKGCESGDATTEGIAGLALLLGASDETEAASAQLA